MGGEGSSRQSGRNLAHSEKWVPSGRGGSIQEASRQCPLCSSGRCGECRRADMQGAAQLRVDIAVNKEASAGARNTADPPSTLPTLSLRNRSGQCSYQGEAGGESQPQTGFRDTPTELPPRARRTGASWDLQASVPLSLTRA